MNKPSSKPGPKTRYSSGTTRANPNPKVKPEKPKKTGKENVDKQLVRDCELQTRKESGTKIPRPTPKAKSTRVVLPEEKKPAEINSLFRLGLELRESQREFIEAGRDEGRSFAKSKIQDSPNTKKVFRQKLTKRLEFPGDEQLFTSLADLSLASDDLPTQPTASVRVASSSRDPEPRLEDFHCPYRGEEFLQDDDDLVDEVCRQVFETVVKGSQDRAGKRIQTLMKKWSSGDGRLDM